MTARRFDPRRLDVRAFAKAAAALQGEWPLAGFERLRGLLAATDGSVPAGTARWSAQGEQVAVRAGGPQVWLQLQVRAKLPLVCQRCLGLCEHDLELERRILFVAGEARAAELDAELEDDVLPIGNELDLHELVEDELLLGLPLVPRHDDCSVPLPPTAEPEGARRSEQPFAALAAWRRGGS